MDGPFEAIELIARDNFGPDSVVAPEGTHLAETWKAAYLVPELRALLLRPPPATGAPQLKPPPSPVPARPGSEPGEMVVAPPGATEPTNARKPGSSFKELIVVLGGSCLIWVLVFLVRTGTSRPGVVAPTQGPSQQREPASSPPERTTPLPKQFAAHLPRGIAGFELGSPARRKAGSSGIAWSCATYIEFEDRQPDTKYTATACEVTGDGRIREIGAIYRSENTFSDFLSVMTTKHGKPRLYSGPDCTPLSPNRGLLLKERQITVQCSEWEDSDVRAVLGEVQVRGIDQFDNAIDWGQISLRLISKAKEAEYHREEGQRAEARREMAREEVENLLRDYSTSNP